jgi:hypothetical protein
MKSAALPLRPSAGAFWGALALGGIEVDTCSEIVHRLRDGSLKPHRNDDVVYEKPQQHVCEVGHSGADNLRNPRLQRLRREGPSPKA